MIGRGANEREPERHIDGVREGERLDRNQRLIVIHGDDDVIALARRGVEQRVGWMRAADGDPGALEFGQRRRDDFDLLASHRAAFAGMGIETCEGESRLRESEANAEIMRDDEAGAHQKRAGETRGNILQRDMNRRRNDGEFRRP